MAQFDFVDRVHAENIEGESNVFITYPKWSDVLAVPTPGTKSIKWSNVLKILQVTFTPKINKTKRYGSYFCSTKFLYFIPDFFFKLNDISEHITLQLYAVFLYIYFPSHLGWSTILFRCYKSILHFRCYKSYWQNQQKVPKD